MTAMQTASLCHRLADAPTLVPPPERPRRSPSSLSLEDARSCSRCWACVHERAGFSQLPAGTFPRRVTSREGYQPHQVLDGIVVERLVEKCVGHAVKPVLKNGIDSSVLLIEVA